MLVLCTQDAARALTKGERERESGGSRWLLELLRCQRWLAGLWARAAVGGGASLLSSRGSRSRCLDGCSRRRAAFPLHLGSPRRREIVLPHQCKRCLLLPSRATVNGKTAPLAHINICTHKDGKAKTQKEGRNVKKGSRDVGSQSCPQLRC